LKNNVLYRLTNVSIVLKLL